MCKQLFTCPLCARPSFESLDSLRIGLVSVSTRPLTCPVCSDTLLGIDKLTIHLFGHTINIQENLNKSVSAIPVEHDISMMNHPTWNVRNLPTNNHCSDSKSRHCYRQNNVQKSCNGFLDPDNLIHSTNKLLDNAPSMSKSSSPSLQNKGGTTQPDMIKSCSAWEDELLIHTNMEDSPNTLKSTVLESKNEVMANKVNDKSQQLTLHIPSVLCNNTSIASHEVSKISGSQFYPHLKSLRTERCNVCGFHFPSDNILILHKQLVHMIPEKDVNVRPEVLLKNYPCHLCSKVFKMRGSLMVHMRVAHTGYNSGTSSTEKNSAETCNSGFNCPTCGKTFRKEQHVTQHLKTHEGKQWACEVCSKMFTTKYFLKKHKRLHSGEMPYKCNICSKTFTFQQSYHKHMLYHKDDKPHTCVTCGRSFKELSTLHNHERIHTGEKPFACETCGKCFRQRVSYLVHRRIHTGVMPYNCTTCGKSFRYKVSQRTHKCLGQLSETSGSGSDPKMASTTIATNNATIEPEKNNTLQQFPQLNDTKYVLIVNNDGQQLLAKEQNINSDLTTTLIANESNRIVNNTLQSQDSDDFFSFVMPTLSNDSSSPSTQMKQLRLSSPAEAENLYTEHDENLIDSSNLQKDMKRAIDGIFIAENREYNQFETINEEWL